MKQQRIISLDLIRTIAILLVIMQHAWTGLQLDEPSAGWGRFPYHALVVMGVPLFFMLSGALMLDARILPIRQFLGRRFKRLLLPYLLWGTVIYALSAVMHKYPEVCSVSDALRCYIPYLLSGAINASYWYLFVLIGLYLLTPFLQRALSAPHMPVGSLSMPLCCGVCGCCFVPTILGSGRCTTTAPPASCTWASSLPVSIV